MTLFTPSPTSLTHLSSTSSTFLITGSSSGIGLSTATLLSSLNPRHNLILLDLHPPPASFPHSPSHTHFEACDITSWPAQRAAFAAGYKRFGAIDGMFVNAGIAEYGDQFFTDTLDSEGELAEPDRRVVRVDLDAAVDTVKLGIHYLRKNGGKGGSVVLTASLAGYLASAGAPVYSAAKHGMFLFSFLPPLFSWLGEIGFLSRGPLHPLPPATKLTKPPPAIVGLMRSLKADCATLNIAISVVAPGITTTPLILPAKSSSTTATHSPTSYASALSSHGVPINAPSSVALAVCWLFDQGIAANGAGIFVQGDKFVDLEKGLAKSREVWMGREMLDLFRGGRGAPLFERLDAAKAKM
jgi:NAD(P)-dependent dehydrogenase (short-subunit alcohol dehydrogenase family)